MYMTSNDVKMSDLDTTRFNTRTDDILVLAVVDLN